MLVKLEAPETPERMVLVRGLDYQLVDGKIVFSKDVEADEFANTVVNSEECPLGTYPIPRFFGLDYEEFREGECSVTPCYYIEISHAWGVPNKPFACVMWSTEPSHNGGLPDRYFCFFREIEGKTTLVPCGLGWVISYVCDQEEELLVVAKNPETELQIDEDNLLFPWIALYPQEFVGLIQLLKLLTPDDENPLTGLLTAKDGPTRICAKQVARDLREYLQAWTLEIINRL
jgi:hypothetical protein